jgi:phosphoglycolate phosphatase
MIPVIFDLDGTLIDSAPDIHRVANEVLALEGLAAISFAQARSFIGNGVPVFVERALAAQGAQGAPADPDRRDRMAAAFVARYETSHELTTLYPGVPEALDSLAARGHPLGLCTNKPYGPTLAALRHFGLSGRFTAVVGGDSLPARKPDPAPLLHALALLGAPRAIFVGDSEVDAETARRAALPFALYTEGYRRDPIEAIRHAARFDDFAALPALVLRLAEAAA